MKAYFSYWIGGWQQKPSEFILDCHRVSWFLAKKYFKEVYFLTDKASSEYFKDIPYDSIEYIFDDLDPKYRSVWSVSKLLAYEHICKKGEPFIHIDYDTFLWKGLPENLLNANVFAQCEEHNSYHWYEIPTFLKHCPRPHIIRHVTPKPRHGINVGIFGGKDLDFIQKYAKSCLEIAFDKHNENFFVVENNFIHGWNKAVIVEQYGLAAACAYYNVKPEFYFNNGWPSGEEANSKNYTHLMGAKNCDHIRDKISLLSQKIKNPFKDIFINQNSQTDCLKQLVNKKTISCKYNLSVGAIFNNEAPYLKEWLLHYLNRGVEHFYLINDESTDNYQEVLEPFKDKITLFNVEKREEYRFRQRDLYNFFFLPIKKETKWITICDIDEYIWSPQYLNLQDVCKHLEKENTKYITIPMVLFGSNNYKEQPESIVKSFTKRSCIDEEYQKFIIQYAQIKTMCQTSEIKHFDIHVSHAKCEKKHQDLTNIQNNLLRLNHYRLQSEEKWKQSLLKPDVNCFIPQNQNNLDPHTKTLIPINKNGNYRTMEMFYEFNKTQNEIIDMGLVEQNFKYNL